MTTDDALAMPRPGGARQVAYGSDPNQYGELRLPDIAGPQPVAIVVHGGCWLADYDLGYVAPLAQALTDSGLATWSIEYRRVGDEGGGWPGTFVDVGAAADYLGVLAREEPLDLDRVVVVGHSAGGHLALWLAGRARLPVGDQLRGARPLPLAGVVSLAGIADLARFAAPDGCGEAVPELVGGVPANVPDRLRRTSPIDMIPLGVRQILIAGDLDELVPASQARRYHEKARGLGDDVELLTLPEAGHFELVDPANEAFGVVRSAVLSFVE